MPRASHRHRVELQSPLRARPAPSPKGARPPGPVAQELGFPASRAPLPNAFNLWPAAHPTDPTRTIDQAPWAPNDPQRFRNNPVSVPPDSYDWGQYALMDPEARPAGAEDFLIQSELVVDGVVVPFGVLVPVVTFRLPETREGKLLELCGASITDPNPFGAGFGFTWELQYQGSSLPRKPAGRGLTVVGTMERPRQYHVFLAAGEVVSLAVSVPGAVAQTVIAFVRGYTAPIHRGRGRATAGDVSQ